MLLPFQGVKTYQLFPKAMPWAICFVAFQADFFREPVRACISMAKQIFLAYCDNEME